jgi:hypothetical protein
MSDPKQIKRKRRKLDDDERNKIIQILRKNNDLSNIEVAKQVGVDPKSVANIRFDADEEICGLFYTRILATIPPEDLKKVCLHYSWNRRKQIWQNGRASSN